MQQQINNSLKLSEKISDNLFGKPEKYDYSRFLSIDEFGWDDELMNKLTPLAEKLNLSQESFELLMELALEMSQKQKASYEKDELLKQEENILNYNKLFDEDSELPKVNSIHIRKFMEIANGAYSEFATPKLKEILEKTGLVYHPEMIKMFHKIGVLSQEDNLSHYGAPSIEELTPAQILYGTNK